MALSETRIAHLDHIAQLTLQRQGHRSEVKSIHPAMPGPLNYWRAFYMIWFFGNTEMSTEDAEVALRDNWPDEWRTNEHGKQFEDKWFLILATCALKEHEFEETFDKMI